MRKELFIVVLLTTIRIILRNLLRVKFYVELLLIGLPHWLSIYISIIRRVIVEFIANWNSHTIRK